MTVERLFRNLLVILMLAFAPCAVAQDKPPPEYRLGPGDGIRVTVFQNADLTLETRVS
jgi:polysaccharide export outer membrane protein